MKEKIGIEKLIELLNEYENTDNWENRYQVEFRESKIISKKFGFIKWLVENDKIDLEELEDNARSYGIDTFYFDIDDSGDNTKLLLMELSIQDEPIRFLCEIIK